MKVKILVPQTGLLNGVAWPEVGETMDLPDAVAKDMADAGHVETLGDGKVGGGRTAKKAEKRPASQARVEKRAQKKS